MALWDSTDDWTGNLVFFLHYGPSLKDQLFEKIVAIKTHGRYVHVGFLVGKGFIKNGDIFEEDARGQWVLISAQGDGINYSYLPANRALWRSISLRTLNKDDKGNVVPLEKWRVEEALQWAKAHIHVSYGWIDNVRQGIDIMWPNNPLPAIIQPDHFNCSNFTAAFLDKAGVCLPDSFTYPFKVSPNDLARWTGLIASKENTTSEKKTSK